MTTAINTTIICAIWHQDSKKETLLDEHAKNISKLTNKVSPIYVFENGDVPPKWLEGHKITSSLPLTIYEAWNLALAATRTRYVMNLNLDDRLYFDAVGLLEETAQKENAALIGGDWKVCYSQRETNCLRDCYPASDLPFVPGWPPRAGTNTRLGSGTGHRNSFGPATMWSMECHLKSPRYPYRTTDGQKILSVADAVWWSYLHHQLGLKLVRIPKIIGNYFSHPDSQAEFRSANEIEQIASKQISLI